MPTYSIIHVLTILTPTFFVLALGYAAGRYRLFDGEKSKGLTELVLDFALPAALFIGVVTFPQQELLQALIAFPGIFSRIPSCICNCFHCYKIHLSPNNRCKLNSSSIGNISFYLVFWNFSCRWTIW